MHNPCTSSKISVILLAGGIGTRMQSAGPKQFLEIDGKAIVHFSYEVFLTMPEIDEIVIVCQPQYRHHFESSTAKKIAFALPGERRQDSVYNGFVQTAQENQIICIHDGVRPFINETLVRRALAAGISHGAATVGMPVKFTVKQSDEHHFVHATPDRTHIWEIQTPQVIARELLHAGFLYAKENNLTVTDDVALVELLGKKVKLVEGSYMNLKVTTPEDLNIMQSQFFRTQTSPIEHRCGP